MKVWARERNNTKDDGAPVTGDIDRDRRLLFFTPCVFVDLISLTIYSFDKT